MVTQVHMTSFFKTKELLDGFEPFSAAVYQPKGYTLPKVAWTDIRENGQWIRPRNFLDAGDPAEAYWEAMLAHYDDHRDEAEEWAAEAPERVALCCWCPFDRAAKRQLSEFGTFICHTGPLGHWIVSRLGVAVSYDDDRRKMYGVAITKPCGCGRSWCGTTRGGICGYGLGG